MPTGASDRFVGICRSKATPLPGNLSVEDPMVSRSSPRQISRARTNRWATSARRVFGKTFSATESDPPGVSIVAT